MPTLHSSRSHTEDVIDVAEGRKSAALVDEHAARLAQERGLTVLKVSPEAFGKMLTQRLAYAVAKTPEGAQRIIDVLEEYPMPRGPAYHGAMGRVLGYSESDIAHFIQTFQVKEVTTMPEEATQKRPEVKQAKFSDAPVKVSFGIKPVNRREASDEPSDSEFHIVYVDFLDGRGPSDAGEAYLKSGDFDVEIYVTRSAQPYAFRILHAAERFFQTRDISIEYVD